MKTIATLQVEEATDLSNRLKSEAILVEVRGITSESQLDMAELLVEDSLYERACDVAESWQTDRLAEAERRCTWICPKCKSRRLECIPNDKVEYLFRCKDCDGKFIGCVSPPHQSPAPRRQLQPSSSGPPDTKLTIFILLLPVVTYLVGLVGTRNSHTFHPAFFWAWFWASIVCLDRGFRIRRFSRILSWICIAIGIIPSIVIVWGIILRGVKSHS